MSIIYDETETQNCLNVFEALAEIIQIFESTTIYK
jgi:hypothetical protein